MLPVVLVPAEHGLDRVLVVDGQPVVLGYLPHHHLEEILVP